MIGGYQENMISGFRPPTRKQMNEGNMPEGTPPTLAQIKKGARLEGKPYILEEKYLIKRYKTDLKTARKLEKEAKEKDKISEFL